MFFWKMVLGVFCFLILNYISPSDRGQCGRFQEDNCKTADQHAGREFVPELSIPERVSTCYGSVHSVPLLFHVYRYYPFLEHI